jgi:hypothetical protein
MGAGSAGKCEYGGKWRWVKYWACLGLLTHSMEQSSSWEADQPSQLVKKFPAFYETRRKWVFMTVVTQLYSGEPWKQLHVSAPNWVGHHQVEHKKNNRENHTMQHATYITQLGAETCSCFQGSAEYSYVTTVMNTHFLPALIHTTGMTPLKFGLPYFTILRPVLA